VRFARGALVVTAGLLVSCSGTDTAAPASVDAPSMDAVVVLDGGSTETLFRFSDPAAFAVVVEGGDVVLTAKGGAKYKPPHRSPLNIALLDAPAFGDFVLDLEMQQTGREYGHRDLCLFFGHQGPARYYYVHIATKADPNAHNVFLVDGAPRRSFAAETTAGIDWGSPDSWHRVRLIRKGASIQVFFDDLETPIMEAEDATHGVGRIGFGSFDDEGRFRRIRIQGDPRPAPAADPFGR
jgi:hypothetical protein